jgi:hypothetical protein
MKAMICLYVLLFVYVLGKSVVVYKMRGSRSFSGLGQNQSTLASQKAKNLFNKTE